MHRTSFQWSTAPHKMSRVPLSAEHGGTCLRIPVFRRRRQEGEWKWLQKKKKNQNMSALHIEGSIYQFPPNICILLFSEFLNLYRHILIWTVFTIHQLYPCLKQAWQFSINIRNWEEKKGDSAPYLFQISLQMGTRNEKTDPTVFLSASCKTVSQVSQHAHIS